MQNFDKVESQICQTLANMLGTCYQHLANSRLIVCQHLAMLNYKLGTSSSISRMLGTFLSKGRLHSNFLSNNSLLRHRMDSFFCTAQLVRAEAKAADAAAARARAAVPPLPCVLAAPLPDIRKMSHNFLVCCRIHSEVS